MDPTGEILRQFLMDKRGDGVPITRDESLRLSGRRPIYRATGDAEAWLAIQGVEPSSGSRCQHADTTTGM